MRNLSATHRLVALIERFAGELKRFGEIEFAERRAPERILRAVAVGVSENGIVRREGLLDRVDCGVPSVARRLDLRIRLDCDFDELRLRKRRLRSARERGDQCDSRDRKHQSTANLYRWHRNSSIHIAPWQYVAGAQRFHRRDQNRLHQPRQACNRQSIKPV
jgi:hypothetical protein